MHRRCLLLIVLSSLAVTANAADDFAVVGALDFAYKDLSLKAPGSGDGGETEFRSTLTTINPGVAVAYKRAYVNVNYDKSVAPGESALIDEGLPQSLSMTRSDLVLTLGYRVFDFLSLFAGYLSGDIGVLINGQKYIDGTSNAVAFLQDTRYKESGPFAGIALSHQFGNKGLLSVSVAYASLNGDLEQTQYFGQFDNGGPVIPPSSRTEMLKIDVRGLSYGLSWTGALSGSLSYRLGVKVTNYNGEFPIVGARDITENYIWYYLGLINAF